MQLPVFESPHDAALWLLKELEGVAPHALDDQVLCGRLPDAHDFAAAVARLEALGGGLFQDSTSRTREIRFAPERAAVYSNLARMLIVQKANLTGIPEPFTLLDSGVTYRGSSEGMPADVLNYFGVVALCQMLIVLSDYSTQSGRSLHFVVRPDAKFSVSLEYGAADLVALDGLGEFKSEFVDSDFHSAEKHAIARDGLAEMARGVDEISISLVVNKFSTYSRNVRASYALLLSKFSAASVSKEVDKQNLEDTLRLNKSFSDIQNQLLALPAALLIAGASVSEGAIFKNLSILLGLSIFVALMWMLISNQQNSVHAIRSEIDVRKTSLEAQPAAVSDQYIDVFDDLYRRVLHQLKVLKMVRGFVVLVFVSVLYIVVDGLASGSISGWLASFVRMVLCL